MQNPYSRETDHNTGTTKPTPNQASNQIILERYITTRRDMQDIEEAITRHLGGEGHRCAFLRSGDFIRLRLAALYTRTQPKSNTHSATNNATHCGIMVTLTTDDRGKLVTLRSIDAPVYPSEFEPYFEEDTPATPSTDSTEWERETHQRTWPR